MGTDGKLDEWKKKTQKIRTNVALAAAMSGGFVGQVGPAVVSAAPALAMVAGAAVMVPPLGNDLPTPVKEGGACLMLIAMILADLQNGKKLGYTKKIVGAMQKIPGLENADENQILGVLCWGAVVTLGGPDAMRMMKQGKMDLPGFLVDFENFGLFLPGSAASFVKGREVIERALGKEISFNYRDEAGRTQKTAPISTSRLFQNLMYLAGGAGITAYGASLNAGAIEWTGAMFMLANGLGLGRLLKSSASTDAKMAEFGDRLNVLLDKVYSGMKENGTPDAGAKAQLEQWQAEFDKYCKDHKLDTLAQKPLNLTGVQLEGVVSTATELTSPPKQDHRR